MQQEGLYQKGLALRAQGRYREAGECFRRAADAGDPDACWEMYMILLEGGCCIDRHPDAAREYLDSGQKLGNELCNVVNFSSYLSLPLKNHSALALAVGKGLHARDSSIFDPESDAFKSDAWLNFMYSLFHCDASLEYVCMKQAATLGLPMAQYSFWARHADRSFVKKAIYQNHFATARSFVSINDLETFATPQDIAQALIVVESGVVDDHDDITLTEHFETFASFSPDTVQQIRFHFGAHVFRTEVTSHQLDPDDPTQFEPEEYRCLSIYWRARQRARAAALALLFVAKRRVDIRRWMALDIWRLVARMVAAEEIKFL